VGEIWGLQVCKQNQKKTDIASKNKYCRDSTSSQIKIEIEME